MLEWVCHRAHRTSVSWWVRVKTPGLLPVVAGTDELRRLRAAPLEQWTPALAAILDPIGIKGTVRKFESGKNPVFEVGERFVVKLVPEACVSSFRREREALDFLKGCSAVPVPQLISCGQLEGWHFLVTSRLPGKLLSERWNSLTEPEQALVAAEVGRALAGLHAVSLRGLNSSAPPWDEFIRRQTRLWAGRKDVQQLPSPLRDSGLAFIAQAGIESETTEPVFLHGDLAPENCLVSESDGAWRVSGIFDFGNGMAGDAAFDLTAPTVLLAPGNGAVIGRFLTGYGWNRPMGPSLRSRLMAYTLLHPMADLAVCLSLIAGAREASSWNEVAMAFWPDGCFGLENRE